MFKPTPQNRVLFPRAVTTVMVGGFLACLVLFSIVLSIFGSGQANAATNGTLNFQARLENTAGNIAPDGNYNVQFKLYNVSSGGSALWTETYQNSNTQGVTVKNGYLSANLGSITAFPGTINWDQDLWVTLNIGGTSTGASPTYDGEMNPRLKLTAVPYAFRAGQLATFNSGNGFTSSLSILQPTSGNQIFQIPDQGVAGTFSLCIANSSTCGFALSSGNNNYIQNQNASAQSGSNFWIDGTGQADTFRAGTALQAPLVDAATASTALNIGTTNANVINLNQNVVVASGKSFTANGPATFQGSVTQAAAFQVLTPSGTPLIAADTTTPNLITNSSFETNMTNWVSKVPTAGGGSSTLSQTSAQQYHGYDSLQAITATAGGYGVQTSSFTSAITTATQYEVTFMARCSVSIGTFTYGRQDVSGGTANDINASTTSTCDTNWRRFTFHYTTGATVTSPNIYMTTGTTVGATIWIDAVQMLQTSTNGAQAYQAGSVKIGGVVTDPLVVKSITNSTNAFEVENAAGTGNNFVVDTVNSQVRINTTGFGANLNVAGTSIFRTTTNNANGFQIQDSNGWQLLNVDTVLPAVNLITNPGFESANTGWAGKGGAAAPTRVTTAAALYFGVAAGQVLTTTAAGSGTSWAQALTLGTTYNFSFYARASGSNTTGINVGYTNTGGDNDCLTAQTIVTGGFTRYTCSFTVTTTAGTAVYIKQTGTTAQTFWIDGAQLLASSTAPVPYSLGNIALRGTINSPVSFQSATNSTTAFQIQNSAGTSNLFVADTLNNQINIGGALNISGTLSAATFNATTALQTGGTTRVDASGNLTNIGTISSGAITSSSTITGTTLNGTTGVNTGAGAGTQRIDASGNLTNINNVTAAGNFQQTGAGTTNYFMGALGLGTSNPQLASALTLANGSWISAIDSTGTGYVNMFQVNGNNQIQVGAALNVDGGIILPTNGGQMTLVDLGIDSAASSGAKQSYSFRVGSTNALTVYGEADGAGNAQNVRVAVGTSINPQYTLDVGGDVNLANGSVYRINGTQICSVTGCLIGAGSTNYIQNQNSSQQATSNFWISGTGRADTALQSPLVDTAVAGVLSIGTTNATGINLQKNVTVAAGQSISLVGGITSTRPASPTAGMLYYDTTINKLLFYNGTKWQADSDVATKTVADGSTSQLPDSADYVVPAGNTSAQTTINSAITSLPSGGGVIYLAEGTYTVDGSISLPSNVKLMGAGSGTVIKFKNTLGAGTFQMIVNSDTTNGNDHITVSDLKLDGNKANNATGTDRGIVFTKVGGGATAVGATITRVWAENFNDSGIQLAGASAYSVISENTVTGNTGPGILINTSTKISVTGNVATSNGGNGAIWIFTSTNVNVSGNTSNNNTNHGIYISTNSSNNTISGNTSNSNGGNGIGMAFTVTNNNVTGNNTASNANTGINLDTASGNTVIGNTVASAGNFGISMANTSSNNVISDNNITASSTHGINIASSSINNAVTNNRIADVATGTSDGIRIASNNNTISGNIITDTAGTGFAINIQAGASSNYLSDNQYSGTGASNLSDSGTGTIYSNQLNSNGQFIMRSTGGTSIQSTTSQDIFTAQQNTTLNLLTNPGVDYNTTGYTATGTGASIAYNAVKTTTNSGTGSLRINLGTSGATGVVIGAAGINGGTQPAGTYTFSFSAMASANISGLAVSFSGSGTCAIQEITYLSGAIIDASGYKRFGCNVTTTTATTSITVTATTTGQQLYLDNIELASGITTKTYTSGTIQLNGVVDGPLILQNATNTHNAFQIQSSSGFSLFQVDTVNGLVVIGDPKTGNYTFIDSNGAINSYGSAAKPQQIAFFPEYPNSVLDAASDPSCVSANSGTMTSGFDGTNGINYYNWTSTSSTNQCYDVVTHFLMPDGLGNWQSNPFDLYAMTDNTANSSVSIQVLNGAGTPDSHYNYLTVTPTTSWADIANADLDYSYGSNNYVTVRIRMTAKNNANVKIGSMIFKLLTPH
jgi:parallel beta-helix repeat protein